MATRESSPGKANAIRMPSASMVRTFWRMRLSETLHEEALLTAVDVAPGRLGFVTERWEDYWGAVPTSHQQAVEDLRKAWAELVRSGPATRSVRPYCEAYSRLLHGLVMPIRPCCREFAAKVLGFQNFVLRYEDSPCCFAAATASFRNPAFLLSVHLGLRKHARDDPNLLPLVVALDRGRAKAFYHYRKQRLLSKSDESLFFFPCVDMGIRPESFRGMDRLTDTLVTSWDSRVEQRSHLLAGKVLLPLLGQAVPKTPLRRSLRFLDVGAGAGQFTSRIISQLVRSGILCGRRAELTLLDILQAAPKRHFRGRALLPNIAKVEYISDDYARWIGRMPVQAEPPFDFVFVFRILHNLSVFQVGSVVRDPSEHHSGSERYVSHSHLSDYCKAIAIAAPEVAAEPLADMGGPREAGPRRVFDASCLSMPCGSSLIGRLARLSRGVVIEDGDLRPGVLAAHLDQCGDRCIRAYNLSKSLRLRRNHVYYIARSREKPVVDGELIWPRSSWSNAGPPS